MQFLVSLIALKPAGFNSYISSKDKSNNFTLYVYINLIVTLATNNRHLQTDLLFKPANT